MSSPVNCILPVASSVVPGNARNLHLHWRDSTEYREQTCRPKYGDTVVVRFEEVETPDCNIAPTWMASGLGDAHPLVLGF